MQNQKESDSPSWRKFATSTTPRLAFLYKWLSIGMNQYLITALIEDLTPWQGVDPATYHGPQIWDRSGYRNSMYDAVWDEAGVWTRQAATELLRDARRYYRAVNNAALARGDTTDNYTSWRANFKADMRRLRKKINGDPLTHSYPAFQSESEPEPEPERE